MARSGANLLTVNQSIPMRGMASVTISARTGEMKYSSEELVHRAEAMEASAKWKFWHLNDRPAVYRTLI